MHAAALMFEITRVADNAFNQVYDPAATALLHQASRNARKTLLSNVSGLEEKDAIPAVIALKVLE